MVESAYSHAVGRIQDAFRTRAKQLSNEDDGLREWGAKYLPAYFSKPGCRLHDTLNKELEALRKKRGQKINIIAPRGYAKSTYKFVKALKACCEKSERYIMLISDTAAQAKADLQSVRVELESNEALRRDYPAACTAGSIWNSETLVTGNNVCIEALGTGMKVRGRKFKNFRPTLVIADDPDNDADILSATEREKKWDWVNKALLQVGETGDTSYVFIGTMLHRECIVGHLERDPRFRVIKFQAIEKWPTNMALWKQWERLYLGGRQVTDDHGVVRYESEEAKDFLLEHRDALSEGAQVLWAAKEDLFSLMEMRAVNHQSFASEKQNDPRDPSKCEFPEEWFGEEVWYDRAWLLEELKKPHVTIVCTDPAKGGETKKHDYSPIILLHYFGANEIFVEADMRKIPVIQLCHDLVDIYCTSQVNLMGFEANGFQELIGDQLETIAREKFETMFSDDPQRVETMLAAFLSIIVPIENTGHKNTRISRLGVWFKRRILRFQRGCLSTQILMQQILDHPHSDHDDGPDDLEIGVRLLSQNYVIGSLSENNE